MKAKKQAKNWWFGVNIFIDTCIIFEAVEGEHKMATLLHHCKNKGYQLFTSISVLGEFINTILQAEKDNLCYRLPGFLREFEITVLYPSHYFSETLAEVEELDASSRLSNSDKLHLAFSYYGGCDFFFTSDKDLRDSNAYENLIEVGFYGKLRKYL